MLDLRGAHWTFALGVYKTPGVAPLCLDLQDRLGVDVNLLLAAAFAAATGRALSESAVAALDATVAPWREAVVQPFRAVRRRIKSGPAPAPSPETDALRRDLQALEIRAEQIELAILAEHVAALPPGAADEGAIREAIGRVILHAAARHGGKAGNVLADPATAGAIAAIAAAAAAQQKTPASPSGQ